jgi:hypothetical protein
VELFAEVGDLESQDTQRFHFGQPLYIRMERRPTKVTASLQAFCRDRCFEHVSDLPDALKERVMQKLQASLFHRQTEDYNSSL